MNHGVDAYQVTGRQLRYLRALMREAGYKDPAVQDDRCEQIVGKPTYILTRAEASQVIEALAIEGQKKREAEGQ